MTRNEFITETAARLVGTPCVVANSQPWAYTAKEARIEARGLAAELEQWGEAPWLTPPAPALTDAARRVVEAACAYIDRYATSMVGEGEQPLISAVRAYKESAK